MTDAEPDFDDRSHEELRALLASARVEDPVPDDVAARLDETLAGLRRGEAGVVPPRRRLAPRLLLAAAALALVGGVGTVFLQGPGAGGGSDTMTAQQAESSADDGAQERSGGDAGKPGGTSAESADGIQDLATVRRDHLQADVARALAEHPVPLSGLAATPAVPPARDADPTDQSATSCPGPSPVRGASIIVRYRGQPVALVVRPATAEDPRRRTAELWTCSGERRLAETVVRVDR
ncbi:MAG TPA: hypothetical protein VFK34_02890 [Marmoricola sp.]|jgi:hypothetical protein|nr:hypothetical protein [Marmoricola sp.]